MKKANLTVLVLFTTVIVGHAQLKMDSYGKVQIGTIGQNIGLGVGRPQWVGTLDVADGARIGNITSMYHSGRYGLYGSAKTYDFNPIGGNGGLIMEQGNSESGGFYVDGDYAVIWSPGDAGGYSNPSGKGQGYLLKVIDEDGMVLKWYLDGSGYDYHISDSSKKKNIKSISGSLTKLKNLKGKKYEYEAVPSEKEPNNGNFIKTSSLKSARDSKDSASVNSIYSDPNKFDPSTKEYYGFLAQEVEALYPEVVETDEKGYKYVCYTQFIPILVEAIKEQQEIIDQQEQSMDNLLSRVEELETNLRSIQLSCCKNSKNTNLKSSQTKNTNNQADAENTLKQNHPNPFSISTQIDYYLIEKVSIANLYIYDMNGKQLKSIQLTQKGHGSITINAGEFDPGMYMYTLIADGKVINTKQMILTD